MNKINATLCALFIASLNLMLHATHPIIHEKKPNDTSYTIMPTETTYDKALQNTALSLSFIGFLIVYTYIVETFLDETIFSVKVDFPYAQRWYNNLAKKYPQAHLTKKPLLLSMRKNASEYSSYKGIYLPEATLDIIDLCYKKKMNGESLSKAEKNFLTKKSIVVLREARNIERNNTTKDYIALATLLTAREGIGYGLEKWMENDIVSYTHLSDAKEAIKRNDVHSNWIWHTTTIATLAAYIYFAAQQENDINNFAGNMIDLDYYDDYDDNEDDETDNYNFEEDSDDDSARD